ncbi:MAG: hypothetical protein H7238_00155 [Polaromonas sp.]|nr:hypothetical protein [Polaromonas sp.]
MNPKTYDAGLTIGTLMLFGGSVAQWGVPVACLVTGITIIGLTLFGAWLSSKR